MIEAAETVARRYSASPASARTLSRWRATGCAVEAQAQGLIDAEIVPLGAGTAESRDEGPRAALTAGDCSRACSRSSVPDGSVTAGNSCQINDGAALVARRLEDVHRRLGSPPGLIFAGAASAGVDPGILGHRRRSALQKLCVSSRNQRTWIDAIEIQRSLRRAGSRHHRRAWTRPGPSSIAGRRRWPIGHPYGASGAILVVRLFTRLVRSNRAGTAVRSWP